MEGFDRERELDGGQPDESGAQHRRRDDSGSEGRSFDEDYGGCTRGDSGAEEHDQHDGGPAQQFRLGSDARGARGGHGREVGWPGASKGRRRRVKDLTDSVNSMAGNLTAQVRNIAEVTTAVANGDLSRKIT